MQLILLSGGSGKRLWPLNNDGRSKQFLPLLASPTGGTESMLQRLVRQIRENLQTKDITVATNTAQRDNIINQLGNAINIVAETERRGTFPAIALASSFLEKEKGCSRDEVVVVMPCDVYTENSYFDIIKRMAEAVEANKADLVLMGVKPKNASDKFGYILPKEDTAAGSEVQEVELFFEKPDTETARRLLRMGACWNAGVFAFRLGYMTDIVGKYAQGETYGDICKAFGAFPKISFDYEVVEREKSLVMVPFYGEWKDLGTWSTLCDVLPSTHIGNVKMGEHNENTHVVNELGIPVFCDGLRDIIIAASPDGILVCEKTASKNIKNAVRELSTRPMYEERRWGTYRVLDCVTYPDGLQSLTKSITLKAGKNISYQIHHHRAEVWTIVDGEGIFVLDGVQKRVSRGDVLVIKKEHFHAIKALSDLTFIEVQTGNPLIEEDIERFDWDWNTNIE